MIVVLDCNIWISLTLNKQLNFLANLSENGFIIATCTLLRNEIEEVIQRPKIAKYLTSSSMKKVMELHDLITKTYMLPKVTPVTADIKDDYLFALSRKSKAHYFITGDKLLLAVNQYQTTKVISLSDFRKIAF